MGLLLDMTSLDALAGTGKFADTTYSDKKHVYQPAEGLLYALGTELHDAIVFVRVYVCGIWCCVERCLVELCQSLCL